VTEENQESAGQPELGAREVRQAALNELRGRLRGLAEETRTAAQGGSDPEEEAKLLQLIADAERQLDAFERSDRMLRAVGAAMAASAVGVGASLLIALAEGAAGGIGAVLRWSDDVSVDFYRQVSQIIPVFMLALAIERRVFDVEREVLPRRRLLLRIGYGAWLAAVVASELLALYSVATNEVEAFFFPVTVAVLASLLILVVMVALGGLKPGVGSGNAVAQPDSRSH
jgi:hypothetical protein